MTETQQRFLKAIAERVNGEHVAELRLYPTVRVGPIESGVAIVATTEPAVQPEPGEAPRASSLEPDASEPTEASSLEPEASEASEASSLEPLASSDSPAAKHERLSILTAHFRLTVKGPDRGKWEFSMVHDANAPIETVENVVRGVARRAGEDGEPELLSGTDFQRALTEPWWTSSPQTA